MLSHVRAGLRLRTALAGDDPWQRAEAIVDPGRGRGQVVHAVGAARGRDAQAALVHAVQTMERVQGRTCRRDPDAVLRAWPLLVKGQWTLVTQVDCAGRRHYIAIRNTLEAARLSAFAAREQEVLHQVTEGASNKRIGDVLGVSEGAVNRNLHRVGHKLRIHNRAEMVGLDADYDAFTIHVGAEQLLVLRRHGDVAAVWDRMDLTAAEREVAEGVLHGLSDNDIATSRGSRTRTVANQLRKIFAKATAVLHQLGISGTVSSRAEFVHLVNRLLRSG